MASKLVYTGIVLTVFFTTMLIGRQLSKEEALRTIPAKYHAPEQAERMPQPTRLPNRFSMYGITDLQDVRVFIIKDNVADRCYFVIEHGSYRMNSHEVACK